MLWTMYNREGQRKYLTQSERAAFLAAAKSRTERVRTFCCFIAATGCRISEALALTDRNLDFEAGQAIIECLKKRGKQVFRAIPLPDELLQSLKLLVGKIQHSGDRLWPWSRMTGYRRIREVMEQAGVKGAQATPKGLRHSFGICAIQSNVPLNLVQRWLGHADIKTTSIYTSAMGPEERQIASRMWGDGFSDDRENTERSNDQYGYESNADKRENKEHQNLHCTDKLDLSEIILAICSEFIQNLSVGKSHLRKISNHAHAERHCHLIHFWLKCIRQYLQSTSFFSGLKGGIAASLPLRWRSARDIP